MKLTTFLLIILLTQASAKSFSQITLKTKKSSLEKVLREIEKQTNYVFLYDTDDIAITDITLTVVNASLEETLKECFSSLPIEFKVENRHVLLRRKDVSNLPIVFIDVQGTIRNENGQAVAGASIRIKGNQAVVISDQNGNFRINVPDANSILVVSSVGYVTQEVKISSSGKLSVILKEEVSNLQEVVSLGYGSVRKSDLTGSVSQIKIDNVNERPISSIEQLIQGQTSGVQITQNTGAPGGAITFNIRGANSISGSNQPLIVIDGYPIDSENSAVKMGAGSQSDYLGDQPSDNALSSLNPSDIVSIEILKDASATAIYGSRGANGVVLVTTRRGKSGRDRIDYSFRTDLSKLPKTMDLLNTSDYIKYANEGQINSGRDSIYKYTDIALYSKTDIDWQDLIFRTAVNQNHQLGLSGGNDKMKYAIALGYLGEEGIVENSRFDRGSIRINVEREVGKILKFGVNMSGTMSRNKAAMQGSSLSDISTSIIHGALRSRPLTSPYTAEDELDESYIGNPLTLVKLAEDVNKVNTVLANVFLQLNIANGLYFKVNGGVNQIESIRNVYQPRGTTLGNLSGGYGYRGNTNSFNYLTEYTLNYNKIFQKKHRINAVAGYTWQEWKRNTFALSALGFPNDQQLYYDLGSANSISKPVTVTTQWALASFLGRINYTFDDRYLLTFTGRSDGSTRLAKGHKWEFFPSVAAGWNLHNENFMKSLTVLSQAKIRASYGVSGNQTITVGATRANMGTVNSVINQTLQTGYVQTNMANDELHWERTKQIDLGIDLGFFKNRMTFSADYYRKKTVDLLIALTIPPSNAYTRYNTNAGSILNQGFEFDVAGKILTGKFKWDASANFSLNRNKILDLGSITSFPAPVYGLVGGQSINIARTGDPIGAFYGYRVVGVYQNDAEVAAGPIDSSNPKPGDFKFKDIDGDGRITASDREIIGNPYPDYIFGISNNFSWKNFSLSTLITASIGQDVVNANRYYLDALTMNTQSNVNQTAYDNRWTGEGTSNKYPRAQSTIDAFRSRFTDFIVEDASFVRLKSVVLSYNFTKQKIPFLQNLKLFASANNLLVFTNYSGFDPEVNSRGQNSLTPGIDGGSIPQFRTFSFGLVSSF